MATLMGMYNIVQDNYSLSELEERLGTTTDQLKDGLEWYIEQNEDKVREMLKEDLWLQEHI